MYCVNFSNIVYCKQIIINSNYNHVYYQLNCRGFNQIKYHYINALTKECDILFLQEHWMLHNNLHKLQTIKEDFHVFSMSGIKEQELQMGRPYGGCAIFIIKTLGYNSIFIETENTRVCSVLSKYYTITIIFILCIYDKRYQ